MDNADNVEVPLEYYLFSLAFQQRGAITYFSNHLPAEAVGLGQTGLHQFYQALLDFYTKTGLDPIDPIAFRSWLESETDIYAALGGAGGLTVFLDTVMSLEKSTPEAIASTLRHRANKRMQMDSLQELQRLISKKEHKNDADIVRLSQLTDQIRFLESEIDYDPLASVSTGDDIADRVEALWELPDFIPTPFKALNRALGYTDEAGVVKGSVHAIVAMSGLGKSTLARTFMNHWVDIGYSCLFINYEESEKIWESALMTQITKQNIYKAGDLTAGQRGEYSEMFRRKMKQWGKRFMVRHDPDTPYFDDLEKWIRDIAGHNNDAPDVIIIDTIQSMFMKGGAGKPRWGQFEEMMVRLEKLAKDLNSAIIITAQENKDREKERREVSQKSDVGGSISIVQKCSVIMVITANKLTSGDESEEDIIMQIQIPKNRITGSVYALDPPLVRYNDTTKSYEPFDLDDPEVYDTATVPRSEVDEGAFV